METNQVSSTNAENSFLSSWLSCETLVGDTTEDILCLVCKTHCCTETDALNLCAIAREKLGKTIIFKSVVLLVCKNCQKVTHIHCHMNSTVIDLIDSEYHLNTDFICHQCLQNE